MKGNNVLKATVISVLAIGLFSAVFYFANEAFFAAAADEVYEVPPAQAAAVNVAETGDNVPEGFVMPDTTVTLDPYSRQTPDDDMISPEEAAKTGAAYIWEVFGAAIDGSGIDISYGSASPPVVRECCYGVVKDPTPKPIKNPYADFGYDIFYHFILDAYTGERLAIRRGATADGKELTLIGDAINALPDKMMTWRKFKASGEESFLITPPDNLEELEQIAKQYAQSHFNRTEVTDVEFSMMSITGGNGASVTDQEEPFTYKDAVIQFHITDDTGRIGILEMTVETKQLLDFNTYPSDVVPGW